MVFRVSYKIERSFAGLVLGKKGKGLIPLKEMPGIHEVWFDRKSAQCVLRVAGVREESCEAVYSEVMRRINTYIATSQTNRFLVDVDDPSLDTAVLVPCTDPAPKPVVVGKGNADYDEYVVSTFIRGSPCGEGMDFGVNERSSPGSSFMELNHHNISRSFQDALDVHNNNNNNNNNNKPQVAKERLYFHISVGKLSFSVPAGCKERYLHRNTLTGGRSKEYLKEKSMGTFFNPNLSTPFVDMAAKRLQELDFHAVDQGSGTQCADGDVTVNLDVTRTGWVTASVELGKQLPQHSKTESQKCVKIVKRRKRMRNLTTMSDNRVDIGASLASYQQEETPLTENERSAFEMCWGQFDLHELSELMPLGHGQQQQQQQQSKQQQQQQQQQHGEQSGVTISCVKQVQETYTWVKEVPFGNTTTTLTVRIKKLRKKSRKFGSRDNCVEMNLYLEQDRENISGEDLADEMMELRKWVQCILE